MSNVSHELRSLITSMRLYHDLMRVKPDKTNEYHESLGRELDRLSSLIEDLLGLSRIDQGYCRLDLHEVDLSSLVEQYATDRELLAQERGLELIFVRSRDLVLVSADKSALGQVLSELITNVVNYSTPGGKVTMHVQSSQRAERKWACLQVSDTGLGIVDHEKDQVFDRFFRGSAGQLNEAPWTGLGLAIARELVERQGGDIDLQSPGLLGSGTTFRVWLPAI